MKRKGLLNGFIWVGRYVKFSKEELVEINTNRFVNNKNKRYSQAEIDIILKMKENGCTVKEISAKYKISKTHLYRMIRKSKLK